MANEINVQLGEPHTPRIGLERIMYSPTTIILDPTPATTEQAGVVELATNAETLAGTDTERAVTPSGLHSTKGAAGGFAELDSNGKVPSSQLPSFVDDVVEAYYKTADDRFYEEPSFTTLITPSAGKSWVDIPTNKSYRWTGSVYVRVDEGVQLGETSDTAYRGDRGKVAYDHATDASRNTTAKAKKLYKMSVTEEGHVGQVEESTAEEDIEVLQDDVATLQRGEFPGNTRTLTKDEWVYLLSTRSASTVGSTANARFIKCTVNSVYGLMILPDVFTLPSGITMSSINTPAAVFSTNVYTSAQWEILEDLGCVFLPTTGGRRDGTTLETSSWAAFYMTSTVRTDTEVHKAFHIAFSNGSYNFNEYSSVALGGAVRLATEDNVKGLFSISASTKCNIAKSNLQYHCLNKTWRFAENAYDTIGNGNTNISENYNGWIDLFGYGTSGWNSGVTCYQPWSSSTQESDYIQEDLAGDYAFADWGKYNIKRILTQVAFSEFATDAETQAGTATDKAVTPHGLATAIGDMDGILLVTINNDNTASHSRDEIVQAVTDGKAVAVKLAINGNIIPVVVRYSATYAYLDRVRIESVESGSPYNRISLDTYNIDNSKNVSTGYNHSYASTANTNAQRDTLTLTVTAADFATAVAQSKLNQGCIYRLSDTGDKYLATSSNTYELLVGDATDTAKGVVELATSAEAEAGTDTERVLTPKTNRDAHDAWHWFGTQAEFDAIAPDYDPNVIYHVENTEDTGITLHWTDDVATLASNNLLVAGHEYAKLPTGDTDKRNITNLYLATSSSTYITLWNL